MTHKLKAVCGKLECISISKRQLISSHLRGQLIEKCDLCNVICYICCNSRIV